MSKMIKFTISGMDCPSCAVTLNDMLKKVPGVIAVSVNYLSMEARITCDPDCDEKMLQQVIEKAGYGFKRQNQSVISHSGEHEHHYELRLLTIKLIVSVVLTIPLFLFSMILSLPSFLHNPWILLILATPIQFWVGWQFYISAWNAFTQHRANMDTLIALGSFVAYFYSVAVVIFGASFAQVGIETHLYFETSAMIITLIFLGGYLEMRAKSKTTHAIQELIGLQVKRATIKTSTGEWIEVPIDQIKIDDIMLIKPGQKIPTDGIVVEGESHLDESMISGESAPVLKKMSDEVVGATINKEGSLQIRATKVGEETLLAKIIEQVKRAQGSRAPVQKMVDKVAAIFVPIVIILAFITFLIWFNSGPEPRFLNGIVNLVAVLIIACPCALGLATPTSIMVGMGRGAQEGILIKDAQTLEIAGKLKTIIFDKTGTLTKGEREVSDHAFSEHLNEERKKYISSLMLALESLSEHPVSDAIARYLKKNDTKLSVQQLEAISGRGVKGSIDGHEVLIGSKELMIQENVHLDPMLVVRADVWATEAKTVSFGAIDKKNEVLYAIADIVRADSLGVIQKLSHMGITSIMITGDNPLSAHAVAQQIGIKQVHAEVMPAEKQIEVEKYKKQGKIVGMVGDGINDAPALAASDVGIAMGGGTDVAIETAGVTLLKNDISLVPKVIVLAKKTMRNINQNLVWAFGYNIVLIPVAMGFLYPFFGITINPIFASAAMSFSSLSVVVNALRLKRVTL